MRKTKSARLRFLGLTQKSAARKMGLSQGVFDRKLRRCEEDVNEFLEDDACRRISRMREELHAAEWKAYKQAETEDWKNRKR